MSSGWQAWQTAWHTALYGEVGFYRRPEGPAGHFRTASHAAPKELARAVAALAEQHGCRAIVDVGAGRGELLLALAGSGLRLHGCDVVPRPSDLPAGWTIGHQAIPPEAFEEAMVIGWELLDVVPCPVLEVDEAGGLRQVEVDPTGRERPGPPATAEQVAWQQLWWPIEAETERVEIGASREALWAELLTRARAHGARAALAVDYAHLTHTRPLNGSLTGFHRGRAVPPRPDGSTDITAHLAIDAVAARVGGELTPQADALLGLGVERGELLDPHGLGGFHWLTTRLR